MAKKLNTTKPTRQSGQFKPAHKSQQSGRAWSVQKSGNDVVYKRLDGHFVKMPPAGEVSTIVRGGSVFSDPTPSKAEPQGK